MVADTRTLITTNIIYYLYNIPTYENTYRRLESKSMKYYLL